MSFDRECHFNLSEGTIVALCPFDVDNQGTAIGHRTDSGFSGCGDKILMRVDLRVVAG